MQAKTAATLFWIALAALVVGDLLASTPHDRFAEPPLFALGNARAEGAGHCSGSIR